MRTTPRALGILLLVVLWLPGSPLGIRYDRPAPGGAASGFTCSSTLAQAAR